MALDVGRARIGVALSDPGRSLAHPHGVIQRKNRDQVVREVGRLAAEHQVGLLVLGLPLAGEGRTGDAARAVLALGRRLERALGLAVEYVDEFETTVEAEQALLAADVSRARRRQVVDMLAASLILRRYLEGQREEPR